LQKKTFIVGNFHKLSLKNVKSKEVTNFSRHNGLHLFNLFSQLIFLKKWAMF